MARKRNPKNVYFGPDQEQAIKDYIKADSTKLRHKYYNTIIHPAFTQLAVSILSRYGMNFGFFNAGYDFEDLVSMGVTFMYDRLETNKFNPSIISVNGQPVRAFSFFGTVVKRYYIKLSMDSQKSVKRNIDIDNEDVLINFSNHDNLVHTPQYDLHNNDDLYVQISQWIGTHYESLGIKTVSEVKIMKSFLDLLGSAELIDNFNKKALYIYLREMSNEPTLKISSTMKKIHPAYHALRQNYINSNGTVITGSLIV